MKASLPIPIGTPSYRKHKWQFVWQIIIPLVLAIMLAIVSGVYITNESADQISQRADISLIWLMIPLMCFSLIFLIVLVLLIYAIARVLKVLPTYTQRTQEIAKQVKHWVRKSSDAVVKPVLFFEGLLASLRLIMRRK